MAWRKPVSRVAPNGLNSLSHSRIVNFIQEEWFIQKTKIDSVSSFDIQYTESVYENCYGCSEMKFLYFSGQPKTLVCY